MRQVIGRPVAPMAWKALLLAAVPIRPSMLRISSSPYRVSASGALSTPGAHGLSRSPKRSQPSAVAFFAGLGAFNALPSTKGSLPGVVSDEAEPSSADGAALCVPVKMLHSLTPVRLLSARVVPSSAPPVCRCALHTREAQPWNPNGLTSSASAKPRGFLIRARGGSDSASAR